MPHEVKVIFTVFAAVLIVGVTFVRTSANNAGPKWFWRGGNNDPLKRLLFHADGSFRKYTKLLFISWFLIFIGFVWLFPSPQ